MNKEQTDKKGRELLDKAKTETAWWKKGLLWIGGLIVLGLGTAYLSSCSYLDDYDVSYDKDDGSLAISKKPVTPYKK